MRMHAYKNVEATFNYVEKSTTKPGYFLRQQPPDQNDRAPQTVKHAMEVDDARAMLDTLSLDRQGIQIVEHETAVQNLYDAAAVRDTYYAEVADLVKAATGANRVLVFDHNVRSAAKAEAHEDEAQRPVKFVHNDYTHDSGPQRVRDLVDADEVDALLAKRFAVINVWKPISGPVQKTPLAVCCADSIAADDFVPTDLIYPDRNGEIYGFHHNPNHRWLYVSQMRAHEVMLLKCYDSKQDGRARFSAHSAFDDPSSPEDAPERESIEVRTLAFFA